MEDDIDIEEHDVLDNPRIRNIFPDISQIKAEIPDEHYHESERDMEYQPYSGNEDSLHHQSNISAQENSRFGNRIVLGSKPTSSSSKLKVTEKTQNGESVLVFGRKPVQIKEEPEEYREHDEETLNEEERQHSSMLRGMLIVGSKPSPSGVITPLRIQDVAQINKRSNVSPNFNPARQSEVYRDHDEEPLNEEEHQHSSALQGMLMVGTKPSPSGGITPLRIQDVARINDGLNFNTTHENLGVPYDPDDDPKDPTTAYILLENWGPKLENNPCYCKECEILFPTRNTLLAHNMTAHSFLVALDKNKAVKSTAKITKPSTSGPGKFCNHCNKMFPDSDSLINHLYEKLTFDKNKAVFKTQPKKVVANPVNNANLKKARQNLESDDSDYGSKVEVYNHGAIDLFQCEVCSCYLEKYFSFNKHMNVNHLRNNYSKKKVRFNGLCVFCDSKQANKLNYNRHIQFKHPDIYNLKGAKLTPEPKLLKKPLPRVKEELPEPTYEVTYRCTKCYRTFDSAGKAKYHRKTMHADLKSQFVIKKITNYKGFTPKTEPVSPKATVKIEYNKSTITDTIKYHCSVCNDILLGYDKAREHRRSLHPETHSQNIFKRIKNTKFIPPKVKEANMPSTSKSTVNIGVDLKNALSNIIVPKSVLFKCDKCDIHFTSCTAAILHSKICSDEKGDFKCKICKREFKKFDETIHRMQHKICEDFTVVEHYENIYGRVLNQCFNCKLHFHEKRFYVHDLLLQQRNTCDRTAVKCDDCSLLIHPSSIEEHKKWHERIISDKNDMIIVEFSRMSIANNTTTPSATKRPLDDEEVMHSPKKPKLESDSKLKVVLFCKACNCYLFGPRHFKKHKSGQCKYDPALSKKKMCNTCGLTYTSKSHNDFHKKNVGTTLLDMKFITVKDRKVIAPPIPDLPSCPKCQVHFGKQSTVMSHSCHDFASKDSYKICKVCKKKLSDLAYKLHVPFHDYHLKFKSMGRGQKVVFQKPKPQKQTDPVSALLQKYEKLTDTWNILYLCHVCDIVCDSYDRTVEHCQKHYNNMESYDMIVEYCQICHLKFDGMCYERHMSLHKENANINMGSFKILKYRHNLLLTYKWLEQFNSLPATQLQQIVSRSIYAPGRSVKLRVTQDGPPESTIYKCCKCEHFILPSTLTNHYKNVSCSKEAAVFRCAKCNIPFCTYKGKEDHEALHETNKTFKIVYFNEDGDEEFNEKLRDNDTVRKKYALGPKTSVGFRFFKCEKCKCVVASRMRALLHNCPDPGVIDQCHLCQLQFHRSILGRHLILHELNPQLTRNMKVVQFKPKGDGNDKVQFMVKADSKVKLYKCQCGLHFTSPKATEKHLKVCGSESDVAQENCSKCDRLFDTTQLVTHLCKHHSKEDDNSEFEIVTVAPGDKIKSFEAPSTSKADAEIAKLMSKEQTLFKCFKCDVYHLSQNALRYHFENNHQLAKVQPCPRCKLKFMPFSLKKHVDLHHKRLKFRPCDFLIKIGHWDKNKGFVEIRDVINKMPVKRQHIQVPTKAARKAFENENVKVEEADLIRDVHRNVDLSNYNKNLYRCETCKVLFLTRNGLRAHMIRAKPPSCMKMKATSIECDECGNSFYPFSLARHIYVHHQKLKIDREDFRIKNVDDVDEEHLETDDVSMNNDNLDLTRYSNKLYRCKKCKILFLTKPSLARHMYRAKDLCCTKIKSTPVKCKMCGYSFYRKSYTRHIYVHHQKLKIKPKDFRIRNDDVDDDEEQSETDDVSMSNDNDENVSMSSIKTEGDDLIKDVHRNVDLTHYSKNLYRCRKCKVLFLTRGSLNTHIVRSQTLCCTNMLSTAIECAECGNSFHPFSYARHIYVHHQQLKIDPKDFRIKHIEDDDDDGDYTPSYKKTRQMIRTDANDTANSMDDNVSVSSIKTEDNSIIVKETDKNTYKFVNILYKCGICEAHLLSLSESPLIYHFKQHEDQQECLKETCYCGLTFAGQRLQHHEHIHHFKQNLKPEDYYVITINSYNRHIGSDHMFKCGECSICYNKIMSLQHHVEHNDHFISKKKCDHCEFEFRQPSLPAHVAIQHEGLKLNPNDVVVVQSIGNGSVKIITPDENVRVNTEQSNIEFVDCDSIDETSLYEDNEGDSNKTETEKEVSKELYQCDKCKCNFLLYGTVKKHFPRCKALLPTARPCEDCNYIFSNLTMRKHAELHHGKNNLKTDEFIVIVYDDKEHLTNDYYYKQIPKKAETNKHKKLLNAYVENEVKNAQNDLVENVSTLNEDLYTNNLFKCDTCSMHFLLENTLEIHVNNPKFILKTTCTFCSLSFPVTSLATHVYIHHEKMQLNIEHFNITSKDEIIKNISSKDEVIKKDVGNDIITTGNYNSPNIKSETLFKCVQCDLYYLSSGGLAYHFEMDHDTKKIQRCSRCRLQFMPYTLSKHIKLHHGKVNYNASDFIIRIGFVGVGGFFTKAIDEIANTDEVQRAEDVNNEIETNIEEPSGSKGDKMNDEQATNSVEFKSRFKRELIYKCTQCDIYFVSYGAILYHFEINHNSKNIETCPHCPLKFTKAALPKHVTMHHEYNNFELSDFTIKIGVMGVGGFYAKLLEDDVSNNDEVQTMSKELSDETRTNDKLTSGEVVLPTLTSDLDSQIETATASVEDIVSTIENIKVEDEVIEAAEIVKDNAEISTVNDSIAHTAPGKSKASHETSNNSSQSDAKTSPESQYPIKLYKCADCNVCFLSQTSCYKHAMNHVIIDPKDYIECKLCGYQFLIVNNCLHRHITKHHKTNFKPENVLIEEYHPNKVIHGTPKIDIYFGNDRVQSKLVSTTSEANASSEVADDDEDKVSDSNADLDQSLGKVEVAADSVTETIAVDEVLSVEN